jgi:hypothetical protein
LSGIKAKTGLTLFTPKSNTENSYNLSIIKYDDRSLASLSELAKRLKEKKLEAAKQRRHTERKLKEAVLLRRRSTSGLSSLEKKIEDSKETLGEINAEVTQSLARRESLERLVKAAHERLNQEIAAKEEAEIDLQNAEGDDAKQAAQDRLAQITEKIQELKHEIKQRESAAQKLAPVIEDEKKSKSKTFQKIHKQTQTKPELINLIKKSKKSSERLKRQVELAEKREATVGKNLTKVIERLEIQLAKKRKQAAIKAAKKRAANKRALAKTRKAAAKKRARALARKKNAAKRKASKKSKTRKIKASKKATKTTKIRKTKRKAKKSKSKKKKSRR